MKKILLLILCITLTLTSFALPAQADTCTVTTKSDPLSLRQKASSGSTKLASIPKGTVLDIIETASNDEGNWFKVTYEGKTGYISAKYATRNVTPAPTVTETGTVKTSGGTLNLRSAASTESSILAKIPNGAKVTIIGTSGAWYKVKYKDAGGKEYTGYVSQTYVVKDTPSDNPSNPTTPTDPTTPIQPTTTTVIEKRPSPLDYQEIKAQVICTVTASSGAALRKTASVSSEQLKTIPKGKEMVSISETRDANDLCWYKVEYDGVQGYIRYTDISVRIGTLSTIIKEGDMIDTPVEKTVSPEYPCYGKVISLLYVRTSPGGSIYKKDGKDVALPKDTLLTLTNSQTYNGAIWYEYKYDGRYLWSSGNYIIKLVIDPNEKNIPTPAAAQEGELKVIVNDLSVRKGANTSAGKLGSVNENTFMKFTECIKSTDGSTWYKVLYNGSFGYICGLSTAGKQYVTITKELISTSQKSDAAFERYLDEQGFPESYKPGLRSLHEKYPNWVFKADKIKESWPICVQEQYVFGPMLPSEWGGTKAVSIIDKTVKNSWKSTDPGAYENGEFISNWDGYNWVIPHKDVVKYYMDPRNFLNSTGIFQFLDLTYSGQVAANVAAGADKINAGWLGKTYTHTTDNTTINYPQVLTDAGKSAGINPLALVCILTQELGVESNAVKYRPQISGEYPRCLSCNYLVTLNNGVCPRCGSAKVIDKSYYNYFNIGAYTDSTYSTAYSRGLHIAQTKGWDTREKALIEGASYFAEDFLNNNQTTFYYKRFNVINGSNMHQFSTDIQGASGEGSMLSKVYTEETRTTTNLTFKIPVYTGMPETACGLPS